MARPKELENENRRLKIMYAEERLKEAIEKNGGLPFTSTLCNSYSIETTSPCAIVFPSHNVKHVPTFN